MADSAPRRRVGSRSLKPRMPALKACSPTPALERGSGVKGLQGPALRFRSLPKPALMVDIKAQSPTHSIAAKGGVAGTK